MNVAQRIFELLKIKNKKQSELAEYVGISKAAISDWKGKGTNPTTEYLVKICEFLNVSLDYLLTGEEKTNKNSVQVSGSISGSVVQGVNNGSVVVRNGQESALSEQATELLRIYELLSEKQRHSLMSLAFELEEKGV